MVNYLLESQFKHLSSQRVFSGSQLLCDCQRQRGGTAASPQQPSRKTVPNPREGRDTAGGANVHFHALNAASPETTGKQKSASRRCPESPPLDKSRILPDKGRKRGPACGRECGRAA